MSAPSPVAVSCPLCGASDEETLFERTPSDEGAFATEMTTDVFTSYGRIARCRRCRMAYRNPREPDGRILAAYAALQDGEYLGEAECRAMNGLLSLKTIKRHVTRGRLLEVGCSTGFFLSSARLDFDCAGIEPSAWAAQIARERLRLDVHAGPIETYEAAPASFDVVVMIDVIEHLVSPRAAVERAAVLLRPGGLLYVVTPDIGSLSARLLRSYWWGLRPAHLSYFSRATLVRMLGEAGFEVRQVGSYGRIFTYGYWLSRLASYPWLLRRAIGAAASALREDKIVYINTRDSVEIVAARRPRC